MVEEHRSSERLTSEWTGAITGLLSDLDDEIAAVYEQFGVTGVRPRFSMVLIYLQRRGARTIRQLAGDCRVSHSAMSQTITAMRRDGLVASRPGPDARTQLVDLTAAGRRLVPFLTAEWDATEAALAELETQVPYPMRRVVDDLRTALQARRFRDRIVDHLDPAVREDYSR